MVVTRPVNDTYRKRWNEIFKPKTLHEELMEGFKKEQEELEMKKSNKYNYLEGKQITDPIRKTCL